MTLEFADLANVGDMRAQSYLAMLRDRYATDFMTAAEAQRILDGPGKTNREIREFVTGQMRRTVETLS
jgi:GMP synthase PP-ATPase subunit